MAIKIYLEHKTRRCWDEGLPVKRTAPWGFSWTTLFFAMLPSFFRGDWRRGMYITALYCLFELMGFLATPTNAEMALSISAMFLVTYLMVFGVIAYYVNEAYNGDLAIDWVVDWKETCKANPNMTAIQLRDLKIRLKGIGYGAKDPEGWNKAWQV